MKKITIAISIFFLFANGAKGQDENVQIGLSYPAYGVKIKANFPSYTGGWARGFSIVNEDNSQNYLGLGVMGLCNNGISSMSYGWIGRDYNDSYLSFAPNGNVGIGTNNPSTKLSVLGGISKLTINGIDGTFDNIIKYGHQSDLESNTSNTNRWHGIDATITAGDAASNKLKFRLYGGGYGNQPPIDVMTLLGSGNVGIGTTNPAYKLDVLGTIRAKEVLVNLDGGADFVFEKGYKLLPIEHVANYVQENKHLPDIPSANEMVKNGVSMGDMQVKLLQKVEELTLYAIQQDKSKKELERKYNALLEKVEMLTKQIEKK